MGRRLVVSLLALALVPAPAAPAFSQSLWLDPTRPVRLAVEVSIPQIEGSTLARLDGWALFLSGRISVSPWVVLIGEAAVAHGELDSLRVSSFTSSRTVLGNPYVGIEVGPRDGLVFGEFGLRFPIVDEQDAVAAAVGRVADPDRFEAFAPDRMTMSGLVNWRLDTGEKTTMRFRFGPALLMDLDGGAAEESVEGYLHYSAHGFFEDEWVAFVGGISGVAALSDEELLPGGPSVHQIGASASARLGPIRPGLDFRLPFTGDLTNVLDFSWGVHVLFVFELEELR